MPHSITQPSVFRSLDSSVFRCSTLCIRRSNGDNRTSPLSALSSNPSIFSSLSASRTVCQCFWSIVIVGLIQLSVIVCPASAADSPSIVTTAALESESLLNTSTRISPSWFILCLLNDTDLQPLDQATRLLQLRYCPVELLSSSPSSSSFSIHLTSSGLPGLGDSGFDHFGSFSTFYQVIGTTLLTSIGLAGKYTRPTSCSTPGKYFSISSKHEFICKLNDEHVRNILVGTFRIARKQPEMTWNWNWGNLAELNNAFAACLRSLEIWNKETKAKKGRKEKAN